MRQPRLRGKGINFFHTVSRVVNKEFVLFDSEKEHFLGLMRKLEGFTGVKVVSYCLLSNHFHLILEEPDQELRLALTKDELFRRLPYLYDKTRVDQIKRGFEAAEMVGDHGRIALMLAPYEKRMGNVSVFMKELKQGFTQWYNRRNNRQGTLWEGRFKDMLVEGDQHPLMTMAAYIDLNPVRAGMVPIPEDYRWSSYGAAVGGDKQARAGLGRILDQSDHISGEDFEQLWQETAKLYRLFLYEQGREIEAQPDQGIKGRRGFDEQTVEKVEAEEGQMSLAEVIRHRVRYFTDGAVLGSAAFVERIFQHNRPCFGPKRKSGARPMKGARWQGLCVIRDLRKQVIH